ncbi:VWA domain-containing protein [Candidatus Bathyarchaeota archaeon]|nr:VWA domain-containing protein [Candidatus Bathyarchaeota archaeon]MBS7617612.1 VWA domain-containing protein [Candidatus Bathyarchaeota archaeon]
MSSLTLKDKRVVFPFTAFVDQEDLKLSLILNAINPQIGGVLIRGEKGSGKSTIVRALADLLPEIKVVDGCVFNCDPDNPSEMCEECFKKWKEGRIKYAFRKMRVITVPLGVTEDRLIGTLDIERTLRDGVRTFQPGLLAEANRNIVYIDEVNLLPDHIVDDILDAAASGWNIVERETISVAHPSRFLLVGTMNPEEGELRPQLLDRFPLSAMSTSVRNEELRAEIVKRNLEFEADPEGFRAKYEPMQEELRRRMIEAWSILSKVLIPDSIVRLVVRLCITLDVDGHRPDIVILKTAKTLAAFENKLIVEASHVRRSALLVLMHRTRSGGFKEPASRDEILKTFEQLYNSLSWEIVREISQIANTQESSVKDSLSDLNSKLKSSGLEESKFPSGREGGKTTRPYSRDLEKHEIHSERKNFGRFPGMFGVFSGGKGSGRRGISRFFRLSKSPPKNGVRVKTKFPEGFRSEDLKSDSEELITVLEETSTGGGVFRERTYESVGEVKALALPSTPTKHARRRTFYLSGRRAQTLTYATVGRYAGYESYRRNASANLALIPTIQTAVANKHVSIGQTGQLTINVKPEDLKVKLLSSRSILTVIFLLDLSDSMADYLPIVSKVILGLHREAYTKRDKVGVVAFQGFNTKVISHPTRNLLVVARKVRRLKASGYTPLARGLQSSLELIKAEKRRNRNVLPVVILISDGAANVPLSTTSVSPFYLDSLRRAYEDSISVAKSLATMCVPVIAIAPVGESPHYGLDRSGVRLLRTIAGITGGCFYVVSMPKPKELVELVKKNVFPNYITDDEVRTMSRVVKDAVTLFRRMNVKESLIY